MRNEIKHFFCTALVRQKKWITRINFNYSQEKIHFESATRERLIEIKNSSTQIIIEKINQNRIVRNVIFL